MNFQDLYELVRLELLRRIGSGNLTGTALAEQAGFKQGHVSNFLNRKRALSLDGLDRVLAAQNLTLEELIPLELSASASMASLPDQVDAIPVVSPSTAMEAAVVHPESVIETLHVSASRLEDNRSRPSPKRAHWQRFLAIRADAQRAAAMDPMISEGATVVIDRHYNSLAPYRPHQRTLYAVRSDGGLMLRFVEFDAGRLILRPLSLIFPVQLVALGARENPADYLVGRVCLVVNEL